ncbi:hypothetical protein QR680_005944 [Steinernema hermaphroditum]|uniref:Fungal lipase-type domain-containing protein n=1 Tax=Steinernema hermaphroditum TaxID=289476 RepID=A0AA39HW06_9BILA|nr:hypothetical protein QR680_005944 [Steinernema hermaphroditum]
MLRGTVLLCAFLGCVFAAPTKPVYDEELARNKFYPMAAAAYATDPAPCVGNTFANSTVQRQRTVACDKDTKDDTCSGFTAVSHDDKAIILSFRGSEGAIQLFTEGLEAVASKRLDFIGGGTVCRYFLDAFDDLWKGGMKDDFMVLRNRYHTYDVWVTGHSLGGAMATLAAGYLVKTGLVDDDQLKLITFGQPRTGDEAFAKAHDSQISYTFRVVHKKDIVPHLPPEKFEGYYHHQYEVWYNNNMAVSDSYSVCGDESNKCSDSKLPNMFSEDHLIYFGIKVHDLTDQTCKR